MALDPSTQDPCSLLNVQGYPALWIAASESDSTAYGKISLNGVPKTFLSSVNPGNLSSPVLSAPSSTSTFRLVQFLSRGGVAAADTTKNYSQLSDVLLGNGSTVESIVDTYITGTEKGLRKTNYTYSTPTSVLLTDANIWTPGDDVAEPRVSLVGMLIKSGYLLSANQLFTQSQLVEGAARPATDTESLVYLYSQDQGTTGLTAAQRTRKNMLEATNLRFFGAFLVEYCYYRTRYEWLLAKYFTVYKTPTDGVNGFTISTHANGVLPLFSLTRGTGDNQYEGAQPSQEAMLKALAYQMACLSTRMTDMRRLLGGINTYYNGVFSAIQNNINSDTVGSNSELTQTILALQSSANTANGYLSQTEFTKSVMEYNSEKNRYSNILLGLYAFLNIAALATVFQLARGS
jgi:hypothetical protein